MARNLTSNEADLALTLYDAGSLYPWMGGVLDVDTIVRVGVVMREFADRLSFRYQRVIGFSRFGLSFAHAFSSAVFSYGVPILAFGEIGRQSRGLIGEYSPGEKVLMLDVHPKKSVVPSIPNTIRDIYILREAGLATSGSGLLFLVEDEECSVPKIREEFPFL
ncbi:MAG: hypothetical protein AAB687_00620, partial [Patescibacteria group bacterium]